MKQRIRLTESQLHRIIKESVKDILNEAWGRGPSRSEWESMTPREMSRRIMSGQYDDILDDLGFWCDIFKYFGKTPDTEWIYKTIKKRKRYRHSGR